MESIVKEYFNEKTLTLVEEGYSIYEIAFLLNAHHDLILKSIGKGRIFLKLYSNNEKFLLKIHANYPSLFMADIELRKYNVITGAKGRIVFTVKYPATFKKWEEKLPAHLKEELEKRKEKGSVIPESEIAAESPSKETDEPELLLPQPEPAPIEKRIISDYLDGVSLRVLSLKHKVSKINLQHLVEDLNLPLKITRDLLKERIIKAFKNGASRQEIISRFAHLGERNVALMLNQVLKKPPVKKSFVTEVPLPVKKKKSIKITEDDKKAIIEEYKTGVLPDQIAKNRMISLNHILKILRASRYYKPYYQKKVKNLILRNQAIADYFKRGWSIIELKFEFNTSVWKIQRILEKNKLIAEDETKNSFSEKRTKADLAVNYFKKGKSIFEISELLIMTPERVKYLLRKKGFLEEGNQN